MKRLLLTLVAAACMLTAHASKKTEAHGYPINPVPFTSVKVTPGTFWGQRLEASRKVTVPLAFSKCEETGRYTNFNNAAAHLKDPSKVFTIKKGTFPFDDTDPYKTIEGASYLLQTYPDKQLRAYVDSVIDIIATAQEPDGYLYTARTQNPEHPHPWSGAKRWSGEEQGSHELYNLGHMLESAVAHYQATGSRKFLDIAIRYADVVCKEVGPNPGQACVVPGHQIPEMGLAKLYLATGDKKYLDEAKFLLDYRGKTTVKQEYSQSHKPVVEQDEAVGHAVRAAYMYAGMADVAALTGDKDYIRAIDAIWDNIVSKKLYITGGIGATGNGEAFGKNYELPNMTAYCETCASVAGSMFNLRMFRLHGEGKYIDMLERALYNTVLDGYGIAGKTFYYPNRLASTARGDARSEWFGTSCCPTNLCRLIPSVPGYIYATDDDALYWNLFVQSTATATVGNTKYSFTVTGSYPYKGDMKLTFTSIENPSSMTLKVRIPGWAVNKPVESDLYAYTNPTTTPVVIKLNGEEVAYTIQDGYAVLQNEWKEGDSVDLSLPMDIHQVVSNENLKTNKGLCSYERGPLVYCAEGVDNGGKLDNLFTPEGATGTAATAPSALTALFKGGLQQLRVNGKSGTLNGTEVVTADKVIRLVPYFTRAHRAASPMLVWIPTDASKMQQPIDFIDEVKICNSASEQAHNLQGENMNTGPDLGWRDAYGGWISYDLKVDPLRPTDLVLKLWGSDGGNRRFDIYCDGTVFSYEHVDNFSPNEYYYMRHPIPFDLTKDKEKVTIKMQATNSENNVGGLFGVYTALPEDIPEGAVTVDYLWTTKAASRTSHRYSSNGSSGTFRNRTWLDGSGTTGQKWTMKVNNTHRNYLILLYWGDEGDIRNFDIMCDDVFIASESLCHNDPGRFMMRCYPIPEEGTSGKETVRIHLTSPTGTKTGGIFYAYMVSVEDDGTGIQSTSVSPLKWKDLGAYDLQGRRLPLETLSQKGSGEGTGICIVGGRKIAF